MKSHFMLRYDMMFSSDMWRDGDKRFLRTMDSTRCGNHLDIISSTATLLFIFLFQRSYTWSQ
jgi:hypothetical protein